MGVESGSYSVHNVLRPLIAMRRRQITGALVVNAHVTQLRLQLHRHVRAVEARAGRRSVLLCRFGTGCRRLRPGRQLVVVGWWRGWANF